VTRHGPGVLCVWIGLRDQHARDPDPWRRHEPGADHVPRSECLCRRQLAGVMVEGDSRVSNAGGRFLDR
jgi:hypothetical protein